jgi:sialic acid synthase SpsE
MKITVVAEIGANWEGNIIKAKKIIAKCKKSGADAVKFQMWRADDLYDTKYPSWKVIKKSELTFNQALMLKKFADKIKIDFFCSAFFPEAVDFLESINVKRYKIASRTCLLKDPFALETLKKKASTKKPVIISMGMGGNKKKILKMFSKNNKTFCYCISEYPLEFEKNDWAMAPQYDGFSDHTMGIMAPIIFTILKKIKNSKKIYIEKHVKLKNSKGPDASTSITTEQLKELISQIRIIEKSRF